jgi:hypothetical protein
MRITRQAFIPIARGLFSKRAVARPTATCPMLGIAATSWDPPQGGVERGLQAEQ